MAEILLVVSRRTVTLIGLLAVMSALKNISYNYCYLLIHCLLVQILCINCSCNYDKNLLRLCLLPQVVLSKTSSAFDQNHLRFPSKPLEVNFLPLEVLIKVSSDFDQSERSLPSIDAVMLIEYS